ncbi:MAG TPA: hypothetical protein VER17_03170 [Tepidisphaeraceae bacterium]|nr:hypothetical protein [Tepidisphaeraceae bacterium]
MGLLSGDEFRLLFAVLLNLLTLWASWRLARRLTDDRLDAAGDALLLYYLVQYAAVCVPGALSALHPLTIGAVALLCSGAIGLAGSLRWGRRPKVLLAIPPRSGVVLLGASAFALAYLAALIWHQHPLPVMSNDAITYHLPAAVQWLQAGRLGLYEAWYYNPANAYSPLAGSAFIAWLIAPMGNDTLARFVAVGPLVMLFVALLNLCRRLGADAGVASLVAGAAVLSRPMVSQAVLTKDDLFVAAFFVILIDALAAARMNSRTGPWRAGIALGLLLATKYTVLLSLPLVLLMLNREALRPKRVVVIAAWAVILAGPWYLRNWRLSGNPLYPTEISIAGQVIFPGMLRVTRSALLSTPRGVWEVFTGGYYGMPAVVLGVAAFGWGAGLIAAGRRALREPLVRTCLIGPVVGVALFIALAPYGEMRFAYPSIALLFAAGAIGLVPMPWTAQVVAGALAMLLAAMTAFIPQKAATFAGVGAAGAALCLLAYVLRRVALVRVGVPIAAATAASMAMLIMMYDYVRVPKEDALVAWRLQYGPIADVWGHVRNELPRGATVAYANTFFTYPLQGFALDHAVVHAPTRAGLEDFSGMPAIPRQITGEAIVTNVVALLRENPDRDEWLRRLRHSGAQYLVVARQDPAAPEQNVTPPEIVMIEQEPARFTRLFDNEAGSVFKINW